MNFAHDRRAPRDITIKLISTISTMAILCVAIATTSPLLAAPLTVGGASDHRPSRVETGFANRVDKAVELIREQVLEVPSCRAYFHRLGVDLDAWLSPNRPPYVIARKLGTALWRSNEPICGGAQNRPPFEFLFVDESCFRGQRICELASLLLHEMGHLARRDTRDHEPAEFFAVCRLSRCIDPARFW